METQQPAAATSRIARYRSELLGVLMQAPEPTPDDTLLNSQKTQAWAGGVSAMCIWRWMRDDRVKFPQPLKINNRNYWKVGDLRAWADRVQKAAA
jgi:predicted DNA-binding transcriptional regulator AlpA